MREIKIRFNSNGYTVVSDGFVKNNGDFVFKFTEEKGLLEHIGKIVLDKKVEVIEK
jgi:hypothetical protein